MSDEPAACRQALLAGGVAIVPTDTVYGCAADLDTPAGVAALYALKGRPRSQPCQVLVYGDQALADALRHIPAELRDTLRALLPGTTTCVVPDPSGRFAAAAGDSPGSVGVRAPTMPSHFAAFDRPLIATSANEPGGLDPITVHQVPDAIRQGAACVLDVGALPGVASAVVDLRDRPVARLLRAGPDPDALAARLSSLGWWIAD